MRMLKFVPWFSTLIGPASDNIRHTIECQISYVENYAIFYDLLLHGEDIYLCVHCDWQMLHTSSPHCSITITWQASGVWPPSQTQNMRVENCEHEKQAAETIITASSSPEYTLRQPLPTCQSFKRTIPLVFTSTEEGPHYGLLLVESAYQRCHIYDIMLNMESRNEIGTPVQLSKGMCINS